MSITRRIFVSMPADVWLSDKQNALKWGVVKQIESLGYTAEVFTDPRGTKSLSAALAWSASDADRIARRCSGIAIIGLPRWTVPTDDGDVSIPTEYCHYEGAIAYTLGLPMLVLAQEDLMRRVVFDMNFGNYVGRFPVDANETWLTEDAFQNPFNMWKRQLDARRDLFLGYCSSSTGTANNLKRFLEKELGASVLDWQTDFTPGRTILEEIEEAASVCSGGIFLFTNDDSLTNDGKTDKAVPRDNVVFEAGYFSSAKSKDHVLIIREEGTKMPADLGGQIYASLADRSNIGPIESAVRKFVSNI